MRVGFFSVFRRDPQHYVHAGLLLNSIRRTMPGVEVTHFTDQTSPPVTGVDEVRRLPNGKMLGVRLAHYAQAEGNWLLVDTDVLIRRDVRDVFEQPFDIALSDRNWPWLPQSPEILTTMPYNTGVAFSRSKAFWQEVWHRWIALPEAQQDWFSEQRVVWSVIAAQSTNFVGSDGRFLLKILPGTQYNCPVRGPAPHEEEQAAKILHFKGNRKGWMVDYARTLTPDPEPTSRSVAQGLSLAYSAVKPTSAQSVSPIRVFIGYDPRQPVAFHVAAHSVMARASVPVAVTPLILSQLPIRRRGLTEFTYSRYAVPALCDHKGWAIFLDADVLVRGDVRELLALAQANPPASVHVVQHAAPKLRFEWASVMVFDCARCQVLTPAYIDDERNKLFDMAWATDKIGALPVEWNHLVGYDSPCEAKLVHFTQGIPIWPETVGSEYAAEWGQEYKAIASTCSFQDLMGGSVHVQHMKPA